MTFGFSSEVVLCFGNQFRTNALGVGVALILVLGAIGK